ncbi:nitroreductase family protein [Clostridium thermarum]|uniref:nitroreductase family protein n=1 Tax=Clostridium thermarum TaxID=1716543 RepID=UPI0013D8492D|nr:nitroreductase family protein [Clostridium thermarum]
MSGVYERRSIRRYTDEPVSEGEIKKLLIAAMSAPSASNQQPWQFIVIDDKSIMEEIMKVHPYAQMLKDAKFAIIVCGDLERAPLKEFWVQDCSAATENILIAAHELGLGAVWVGIYPQEERVKAIQQIENLPEKIIPLCIIPIGRPGEKKEPANRYDDNKVHRNKW